jgi:hypothetical protein
MEKRSVTCDQCGKELAVDSSYPARYGLHLESRNYGTNTSGITFAIAMYPPLQNPKDFCGKKCLTQWVNEEFQEYRRGQ